MWAVLAFPKAWQRKQRTETQGQFKGIKVKYSALPNKPTSSPDSATLPQLCFLSMQLNLFFKSISEVTDAKANVRLRRNTERKSE